MAYCQQIGSIQLNTNNEFITNKSHILLSTNILIDNDRRNLINFHFMLLFSVSFIKMYCCYLRVS